MFFLVTAFIEGHLLAFVVTVSLEMRNSTTPSSLNLQSGRTGKRMIFLSRKIRWMKLRKHRIGKEYDTRFDFIYFHISRTRKLVRIRAMGKVTKSWIAVTKNKN
jgi:hypothetical protein